MIDTVGTYVRRGRHTLRKWLLNPKLHITLRAVVHFLCGLVLSGASLGNVPQSFAVGLLCSSTGWSAVLVALGSSAGYLLFWGTAGYQGVLWILGALAVALLVTDRQITNATPLLIPAMAALIVAASGVVFQNFFADETAVPVYLLRVVLSAGSAALFYRVIRGRNPILDWLACGIGVLALAQLAPVPYMGLGFLAAGGLSVVASFPAVALAGLALDLAQITPVSMTAVLCGGYLARFLPRYSRVLICTAPAIAYCLVMGLTGVWDLSPLPPLLLGGIIGSFLPTPQKATHRRGETGTAQVRLEMAAGVLAQTEQLLLEAREIPVDEEALIVQAAEKACSGCPCRKSCKDSVRLAQSPAVVLQKPLLTAEEIPIVCRKSGRFLAELHRSQEKLRSIRADRERQREYRGAVVQQYRFLSEYLQDLSDKLSRKMEQGTAFYQPEVQIFANRPEADNGDRCLLFAGVGCRYYVLLCDGMGTGLGAVREGKQAGQMLRRLLTAGYPASAALQSLNSLCALRDRAGAVTVDLAELELDTGRATLYKWGAAPSYAVSGMGAQRLGMVGPPPGLSVTDDREQIEKLTMRRGELLVLVSDGIGSEEALHCCLKMTGCTPQTLAEALLACGQLGGEDDATVVTVRLRSVTPYSGS